MSKIALLVLVAASATVGACDGDDAPSTANTPQPAATAQPAAENRGIGIVQSVDAANGSLTVAHEPIAALGWPAMTMSFKVDRPALLEGVEAGEHIEFTLRGRDMSAVVTSIAEAK
jgi:Cu(I)/Ag(I) efflux system protein CusF